MMLHPGRVVEHQSASSCRAGRCVVVRRARCRVPSVESPVLTFCSVSSRKPKKTHTTPQKNTQQKKTHNNLQKTHTTPQKKHTQPQKKNPTHNPPKKKTHNLPKKTHTTPKKPNQKKKNHQKEHTIKKKTHTTQKTQTLSNPKPRTPQSRHKVFRSLPPPIPLASLLKPRGTKTRQNFMWGKNTEQVGGPKRAKISHGVKSHLFEPTLCVGLCGRRFMVSC